MMQSWSRFTNDYDFLLLQATAIADGSQTPVAHKRNPVEVVASTQPKRHAISAMPMRVLTSSNSFDLKSNPTALMGRFQMSAEAAKLFETLQESPLPLAPPPESNEESVRPTPLPMPYYKTAEEKIKWMEATALKERNHHYGLVSWPNRQTGRLSLIHDHLFSSLQRHSINKCIAKGFSTGHRYAISAHSEDRCRSQHSANAPFATAHFQCQSNGGKRSNRNDRYGPYHHIAIHSTIEFVHQQQFIQRRCHQFPFQKS